MISTAGIILRQPSQWYQQSGGLMLSINRGKQCLPRTLQHVSSGQHTSLAYQTPGVSSEAADCSKTPASKAYQAAQIVLLPPCTVAPHAKQPPSRFRHCSQEREVLSIPSSRAPGAADIELVMLTWRVRVMSSNASGFSSGPKTGTGSLKSRAMSAL